MRIVGGTHRGAALVPVGKGDAAAHLRPTSDRTRESLFNVLQGGRLGDPIRGARVLDLFAGTGALGLESLSRGAVHATFVDSGRAALDLIVGNIAKLRRGDDCTVLACAADALPQGDACGLVFMDPPYGLGLGGPALRTARAQGWIAPGTVVVWEEATAQITPQGFKRLDQRSHGKTWITILEAS
ncbi:RsmD family RNA methyltransferase [Loktanella sp. SALINAS62]|uniref:RsmD family RNA methyltransferase n=1 Tax=Loktanella sp. SALINAS62 TaxID=2706124 RepID=UPI001B8A8E93|nr:RsmD family RNA methyltransferase [Loktanella sp. SALINAS62]MBS1302125.1 16S rRNA (guanine(966)-N(2))-methyltransferase RsmD [Loktanella sp. SALINAS62]